MNCRIHNNYYLIFLLFLVTNMNIILLFFLVKSFLIAAPIVEARLCDVVPIRSWGVGVPALHDRDLQTPVGLVVVTHTVTSECSSEGECIRIAQAIRNNQINNGFRDIGLSFMVGGNGKIYEGAGWKVGAHTKNYNDKSISLSFIGDFRVKAPTQKALDAAERFLGCFLNTHYLAYDYSLVGHRQLVSTISPGDALQRIIQTWPHWTHDVSNLAQYKN
ncbi:peptidoglycan recognition protein-like [Epargyreus clarus]|uniref:peptidoglycan recognition protein-like n=1 Tax=Epargyreus clarus TaxID=520877 RepID=UPI003C2C2E23